MSSPVFNGVCFETQATRPRGSVPRDPSGLYPFWSHSLAFGGLPISHLCCIIRVVCGLSSAVECLLAKEKVKGSNPLARSWRRSQVVRQGSAKALFVGSIPTVAFLSHKNIIGHSLGCPFVVQAGSRGGGGMADAVDLKSSARKSVWVRLPPAPWVVYLVYRSKSAELAGAKPASVIP
jgi:hypothetical protein